MQTRVDRVCLYRNGALVVRVGEAGPGEITIDELPLLHATDALRVRPAVGVVSAVRETCRVTHRGDAATRAPADDEDSRRDARLAEIEAELTDLGARLDALRPAADHALDPTPPPDIDALIGWHDTLDARHDAIEDRRRALRDERRALKEAAAEARRARDGDRAPPRFTRGVAFTLGGVEGPTRVEVEYFVAAARWVPAYALDLTGEHATLRFDALVAQATGEDWSDARVEISTAELARDATAPALTSWRIGPAVPPKRAAFRPLPDGLDALFVDYDRARREPPPPARRPAPASAPVIVVADDMDLDDVDFEEAPKREYDVFDGAHGAFDPTALERAAPPPGAPPMPARPSMAPPAPMMAQGMPAPDRAAPMKKRARGGLGGLADAFGGGGGAPPSGEMIGGGGGGPPPPDLPDRLRYAYTRLAGPDEPGRGRLWPVDVTTHLATLVADHDTDAAEALPRAIAALRDAARRLAAAPTPPGTRSLAPDGYPTVRAATGAHDLPGDGRWHRVPVTATTAPAAVDLRAVPRESNDVWRFCTVRLDDGEPLPQGPLRIQVDGRYRATGQLERTGGGAPLELNLGLEPAVRIVERKVDMMQSDKGLVSQSTRVDHHITTRIRSGLDAPTTLVLYDRLPVPADPDDDTVEVELLDGAPERTDRGPDGARLDGGLRWTTCLPARGVIEVEHTYRITFPAKLELAGGNRRE